MYKYASLAHLVLQSGTPGTAPTFPFHLLLILGVTGLLLVALAALRPAVNEATVVAFVPWVGVAAGLALFGRTAALSPTLTSVLRPPLVYLVTLDVAALLWLAFLLGLVDSRGWSPAGAMGILGLLAVSPIVGVSVALDGGAVELFWTVTSVALTTVVTATVWAVLALYHPAITGRTGVLGALVVFGQVLDSITTMVGIDVLGLSEQTPLSRAVLDLAGLLPTADLLGVGWLFTLLKLAMAVAIVWTVADHLHRPAQKYLLLGVAATAGLGPGFQNLLLYAIL
ncbi:DUF63 family protein [Halomarina litorea]|uniref:DUF63 family protein n=1 Tax=Halomarina litorea TaxID=2961595 RepID=UPI0021153382|nr:DUF63 family protein [Halomarina sp. BCD28]